MEQEKSKENHGGSEKEAKKSLSREFSFLISLERSLRWETAKKFWSEKKEELGCSYNRYAVIEKGTAKASLDLALRIIRALDITEDSGLFAWVRDLMPDEQTRGYFPDPNLSESFARTPLLFLNKAKTDLFRDEEYAFELAGYISMYTFRGVSEDELCTEFLMDKSEIKRILMLLLRRGVILKNPLGVYEVPDDSWIQIPDHSEFRFLKNRLFSQILDSQLSAPFNQETTIKRFCVRPLSQKQLELIRAKCFALTSWIGMLPDEHDGQPYRFFLAGNLATFGNARKKIFEKEIKTKNTMTRRMDP